MSSDSQELPPTQELIAGKYKLLRLIGRGGMGAVWEGKHSSLGTRVAIKFIEAEYADSQEARTRFDNEARAAATIQSKHAIQIYDHGVSTDGKPYIVMELLNGEPLDQRIERLARLSLQDTARILRQVARALGRAHELGVVHRDLKPENIFLVRTPDEDDEIAKVLDFGIAKFKRLDQSGGLSSSTKTGAVLGTPFYMSPEQARGLREVDHRTDLWSLGVIAFKAVTGVLPFEGVSVGDLLVKICTSPPPVPSHMVPGLPTSFDAWFARALDRDPARRFQTAQELSDALAYAAGLSVRKAVSGHQGSIDGHASTVPSAPVPRGLQQGFLTPTQAMTEGGMTASPDRPPVFAPGGTAVTSAPFTASNPPAIRSRAASRLVIVAVTFAFLGVAVVLGAVRFIGARRAPDGGTVASATAIGSPAPPVSTVAPPVLANGALAAAPDAGAPAISEPVASPVHPITAQPVPQTGRPQPRGPHGKPIPGTTTNPPIQLPPFQPLPQQPPPQQVKPQPQQPNAIDPGY